MSIRGLWFQGSSTIKIQLGVLVLFKTDVISIIISSTCNLFSPIYSWKTICKMSCIQSDFSKINAIDQFDLIFFYWFVPSVNRHTVLIYRTCAYIIVYLVDVFMDIVVILCVIWFSWISPSYLNVPQKLYSTSIINVNNKNSTLCSHHF